MSFSDLVDKQLKEKAESKSQRRLMGWARACKKGETDCPDRVKNVAKSFSDDAELKKYAKTKHKGLPEKKHPGEDIRNEGYGALSPYSVNEGPAYGSEQWDDYEGDRGAEEEMIAWTGGSGPPPYKEMDIRTQKMVRKAYQQQVGEYASGWGNEPDDDTKQIFWNRAMHDVWATTRQTAESVTLADLDSENILGEKELSTAAADAGPDKDGEPYFETPPEDAGSPEWHEPKVDFDSVAHRSNLRGVIKSGTRPDMENKAYKNSGRMAKPKFSNGRYNETIRVNHPVKGNGTVMAMNEGRVVIEWDNLNLRPLGPETLTKAEAQYVTVTERYSGDPDDAEMGPKSKKKKDKEEVEEGEYGATDQEIKKIGVLDPEMIDALKTSYGSLNTIDPEQDSYWHLTRLLDNANDALLKQLVGANIKFVTPLARNRLLKRRVTEDQYEQQPSFQVAPPPSMTIFQDQETDEDWSADPLSTQRGADAAGEGDAPDGEMEEPDDAPDDLNVDQQDLPDSSRAEQIAGEVFSAFDGEGGSSNEIDYKSDQVDFAKQNDNSHNKEDGGEAPRQNDTERDDSEGDESKPKKSFPARDKGSDEGESEDKGKDPREPKEDKEPESKDDDSEDEDKKEKAEESLNLSDFDIEGILD